MTPPTYRKSTHAYEHPSAAEDVMRQVDIYVPDSINESTDGIDLLVSAQLHLSCQLLLIPDEFDLQVFIHGGAWRT
jgi:hypothetical protein